MSFKRSGFKRTQFGNRKPREPEPASEKPALKPLSRGVYGVAELRAAPKAPAPVRDEDYRRLVAQLPCKKCGIETFSQCAHVPPSGKGVKESDLDSFALCCTRPGELGCHVRFDRYLFWGAEETREIGRKWAAETRKELGVGDER